MFLVSQSRSLNEAVIASEVAKLENPDQSAKELIDLLAQVQQGTIAGGGKDVTAIKDLLRQINTVSGTRTIQDPNQEILNVLRTQLLDQNTQRLVDEGK